jgi:mannitol-1-/sugar-/sorbitol-6-phosphatase
MTAMPASTVAKWHMPMSREKNQTLQVRGLLIDMDGVLISSTGSDERCWLRWARFHDMEGTFPLQATHGRRAVDTLRELRPDLDATVELARLEEFDLQDRDGIVVLPGVQKLIASLPLEKWLIVTSASERLMRSRLQFAGVPLPRNIVPGDRVTHGKPHPEPYKMGAAILGVEPSECLVIEDAPAGIESGKAAGCRVLGVLTSHSAYDLAAADWIVPSLEYVTASPAPNGTIAIQLVLE